MSDTPRTDAALLVLAEFSSESISVVPSNFARELERENNALRAELAREAVAAKSEVARLAVELHASDKRIAELEAALQAVRDWYDYDGSVGGCDNLMEDHVEPLTKKGRS